MKPDRAVRRTLALAAIALTAWLPTTASARATATLHATLTPKRLGQGTTIGFGFDIHGSNHELPPPLTGIEIRYPVELAFALSELGLAHCSLAALETFGLEACPSNSFMGYGIATAEIPFGPEIIAETAQVNIVRATDQEGHLALLVYADGRTPVNTEVVFPGLVLSAPPPYGGALTMNLPLVPVLPGAPDISIVHFRSTLGPRHLRYHEYTHGRRIEYEPKGIPLPETCPHGGFQFAATLTFIDGSQTDAHTTVSCPRRHSRQ